jgi:5-methylcytosine-specific restriction endonuclease McrA
MGKSRTIQKVCEALLADDRSGASQISRREYPFVIQPLSKRKYNEVESTRIFIRDGFIDRYSGDRLVFPGVLRLLSRLMPEVFPFHPNWKMSECHIAYWELSPTIDHIVPVARGGADDETNWVTTSMMRNSAKSNWTLEELGWQLHPPGDFEQWDGMTRWFLEYLRRDPSHLSENHIKRWYNAAVRATANS